MVCGMGGGYERSSPVCVFIWGSFFVVLVVGGLSEATISVLR